MTDFLTNIVARGLNMADVVQPRVPTLFEPFPMDQELSQPMSAGAIEDGEDIVTVITRQMDQKSRMVTVADDRSNNEPTHDAEVVGVEDFDSSESVALFNRKAESESAESVVKHSDQVNTKPKRTGKLDESLKVKSQPATHQGVVVRQSQRSSQTLDNAEPANSSDRTTNLPIESTPFLPNSVAFASRLGSATQQASKRPAAALTTSAPSVRIVIGRVDVRAMVPPALTNAPPPPRPKPGLSLEDYLKQREEGKR